jgi:hypothetical protein
MSPGGKPMTNTNREEWEAAVKELRHLAALLYNGGTPAPQQSGLDVDAAATLIETQGREIERYREALTRIQRSNGGGTDPSGYMRKVASEAPQDDAVQRGDLEWHEARHIAKATEGNPQ